MIQAKKKNYFKLLIRAGAVDFFSRALQILSEQLPEGDLGDDVLAFLHSLMAYAAQYEHALPFMRELLQYTQWVCDDALETLIKHHHFRVYAVLSTAIDYHAPKRAAFPNAPVYYPAVHQEQLSKNAPIEEIEETATFTMISAYTSHYSELSKILEEAFRNSIPRRGRLPVRLIPYIFKFLCLLPVEDSDIPLAHSYFQQNKLGHFRMYFDFRAYDAYLASAERSNRKGVFQALGVLSRSNLKPPRSFASIVPQLREFAYAIDSVY